MPRSLTVASLALILAPAALASDLAEVKARGALRVAVGETEQPEMYNLESGGAPGFERELLEGFARFQRIGVEVVRVADREERIPTLLRDEADVVIGLVASEARRQRIGFTREVMPAPHVVVTRAPTPVIESLDALRTHRVGVLERASWEAAVAELVPEASRERFTSLEATVAALESGTITATVMSIYNYVLVERDRPGLQAGVQLGEARSLAWGVRREDEALRAAFDEYLENVRRSSFWSQLVVKYFGEQALEVLGRKR